VRIRALAQRIEARFKSFFRGAAIDAASPAVSSPGVGDGDDALDDDPDDPDPTLDLSEQLDAAVAAKAGGVYFGWLGLCVFCCGLLCCWWWGGTSGSQG
jgi:hypothetical protein